MMNQTAAKNGSPLMNETQVANGSPLMNQTEPINLEIHKRKATRYSYASPEGVLNLLPLLFMCRRIL